MIVTEETVKKEAPEVNFLQYYLDNKLKFKRFNFRRNNCSNTVKEFLNVIGIFTPTLTPWADTVRTLGGVSFSPKDLQPGDIVAMGRPGDTHHVGIYMGGNKVLHQSGSRGYVVGVYNDLNAFINHKMGFYSVRPDYSPVFQKTVESLIASPEPLMAPVIGS